MNDMTHVIPNNNPFTQTNAMAAVPASKPHPLPGSRWAGSRWRFRNERMMGFPDGYTAVPFRSKPASDDARYKALGNSWAVNCARWIGERIAAVDAITNETRSAE